MICFQILDLEGFFITHPNCSQTECVVTLATPRKQHFFQRKVGTFWQQHNFRTWFLVELNHGISYKEWVFAFSNVLTH